MPQPMPVREGGPPPDDAVVVIRGGVMARASLEKAAVQSLDFYGLLAISVEAVIETTVDTACRNSPRLAQYHQVRLSSFGQLRAGGFALVATFEHPHFSLLLPDVSELTIARLDRCFGAPIPNPGRRR